MVAQAREAECIPDDGLHVEDVAFSKVAWRLLPILVVSFALNFLDRTNVGVAALTMNEDIGLSASQFGLGSGLFFLGYCLFDVPSNLLLYRFGARIWLSRIMVTWGIVSAATIFVTGPYSFYFVRFLLGVAEAGFFPGVAFYLSAWFPKASRAKILTWFLVAIPASSLIGSPLSGLLLELDGVAGLAGWKWLLIIEALPTMVVGLLLLKVLADGPEQARWLTGPERLAILRRLDNERSEQAHHSLHKLVPALRDIRVLLLAGVFLALSIGSFGVQIWLPLIIKHEQQHFSNLMIGLISAIPFLFATVAMVIWAVIGSRRGSMADNVIITCALASMGFAAALIPGSFLVSMIGITIALIGMNASRGFFWAIPSQFLTGVAAAGGIAFINMIGVAGGFIGPWLMGSLKDLTGSFEVGLAGLGGSLLIAAILVILLKQRLQNGEGSAPLRKHERSQLRKTH